MEDVEKFTFQDGSAYFLNGWCSRGGIVEADEQEDCYVLHAVFSMYCTRSHAYTIARAHTYTHPHTHKHTHARTLAYTTHTCSWFFITLLSVPLPDLVCIRRINKRKLTIPSLLRKPFLRYNNKKHLKHSFFRRTLNFTMLF